MVRLERSRRGKTPIDVTITEQNDLKRVRLTMGEDSLDKKNSDLTTDEADELAVLLQYHSAVVKGDI